jgi:hypothetical protein
LLQTAGFEETFLAWQMAEIANEKKKKKKPMRE